MVNQKYSIIDLVHKDYVPVIKDSIVYYGGSQMWFPKDRWFSKNYILYHYGCGTIATADLFLYLAIRNEAYRNPITEAVLQGTESAYYADYLNYVKKIDSYYTKTKRFVAVLGPHIATAINDYSRMFGLKYRAKWKWSLTYYDMLEAMEDMLSLDIPVILSIGPNTPKLWGRKGISFYQQYSVEVPRKKSDKGKPSKEDAAAEKSKEERLRTEVSETELRYRYNPVKENINSHYVTVTGVYKDPLAATIMLHISSWGSEYYINYEEYRDYVNDIGGMMTSSIVSISRKM